LRFAVHRLPQRAADPEYGDRIEAGLKERRAD